MIYLGYLLGSTVVVICAITIAMIFAFAVCQALLAFKYAIAKSSKGADANSARPEWHGPLPTMLVQLPLFNELYVVERLLNAVAQFDYPKDLLTIQVLDDSTDETTALVAKQVAKLQSLGFKAHHIHRTDRTGYKAGALQAGLAVDKSEFVAIFDADFVPQPTYLKQVLGYFETDNIGLVQTRWAHINRDESILTRLLSFGIDAHFSVEQGGRQASGAFINFNGTAGVWRRKTIDDASGWSSDCLTEDLDLSFRAQLKGWRFRFIEDITTPSELPATMSAVRTQQFRWTKGAAETGRKNLGNLWRSAQPFATKLIGTFHMLNSMIFLAVLILGLSMVATTIFNVTSLVPYLRFAIIALSVSFVLLLISYATADIAGSMGDRAVNVVRSILMAGLFIVITTGLMLQNSLAVIEALRGKISPFVRTPKVQSDGTKSVKTGILPTYLSPTKLRPVFMEMVLALIFLGAAVNSYGSVFSFAAVTFAFIALGFLMVIFFSVREIFDQRPKAA